MTSSTLTQPTRTQDQVDLLDELNSLSLFEHDEYYTWFMQELEDIGIETVEDFDDRYEGCMDGPVDKAGASFAQDLAESCGDTDLASSWIEIDWEASWHNLSWDYDTIERENKVHGFVKETFFFRNY